MLGYNYIDSDFRLNFLSMDSAQEVSKTLE